MKKFLYKMMQRTRGRDTGNDLVSGNEGNDAVYGGAGDDLLMGFIGKRRAANDGMFEMRRMG